MTRENTLSPIATFGAIIATVCSWSVNHSVGWAVLHLLCGWFYVIYYLFEYAKF